jgi:DNA adenine methylase
MEGQGMPTVHSPLRYPGGKQVLSGLLSHLIRLNGAYEGTYAEAYAGGAGAALSLLFGEHVQDVMINDADPAIASLWRAILSQTDAFAELIDSTPLTIKEWQRQREIYRSFNSRSSFLKVGFAAFYLNRCNRSGIIATGGPIGGIDQKGKWKLDARFNRLELIRRVRAIARYKERIQIYNLDAIAFLKRHLRKSKKSRPTFVYLDPPYFVKGRKLYLNYYEQKDHEALSSYLKAKSHFEWVLSYDNVPEIRKLYAPLRTLRFDLDYTAAERSKGKELLIFKDGLEYPPEWKARIPKKALGAKAKFN